MLCNFIQNRQNYSVKSDHYYAFRQKIMYFQSVNVSSEQLANTTFQQYYPQKEALKVQTSTTKELFRNRINFP